MNGMNSGDLMGMMMMNMMQQQQQPRRGPSGVCFDFQRTGSCSRGDSCRYAHSSPNGGVSGAITQGPAPAVRPAPLQQTGGSPPVAPPDQRFFDNMGTSLADTKAEKHLVRESKEFFNLLSKTDSSQCALCRPVVCHIALADDVQDLLKLICFGAGPTGEDPSMDWRRRLLLKCSDMVKEFGLQLPVLADLSVTNGPSELSTGSSSAASSELNAVLGAVKDLSASVKRVSCRLDDYESGSTPTERPGVLRKRVSFMGDLPVGERSVLEEMSLAPLGRRQRLEPVQEEARGPSLGALAMRPQQPAIPSVQVDPSMLEALAVFFRTTRDASESPDVRVQIPAGSIDEILAACNQDWLANYCPVSLGVAVQPVEDLDESTMIALGPDYLAKCKDIVRDLVISVVKGSSSPAKVLRALCARWKCSYKSPMENTVVFLSALIAGYIIEECCPW